MSNWINVNERLPEKSGWYAIYTEPMIFCVLPYSARHKAFNAFDESEDTKNAFELTDGTYWTSLPALPRDSTADSPPLNTDLDQISVFKGGKDE